MYVMRQILLIGMAFTGLAGMVLTGPSAGDIVIVDTHEEYSVDNLGTLEFESIVYDVNHSFGVVVDAPILAVDLETADDKGFTGFDLVMDTREHPRIRDDLVYSIHENTEKLKVQLDNPTIRSPV